MFLEKGGRFLCASLKVHLFLVSFLPSQLSNSSFNVATELLCKAQHLHLLRLFCGVSQVLLQTHLSGIDRTLHTAQSNPHLFVKAMRVVVLIDGKNLTLLLF